MRSRRRFAAGLTFGLTLAAVTFVAACADGPSAPTAARAASADKGGIPASAAAGAPGLAVAGALRAVPLANDITVQQTIGPEGGVLEIPETGMRLDVPAGAVSAPTVFTATALSGSAVAYDFSPHGTFPVALTITQDMKGITGSRRPSGTIAGVYVRDLATIDRSTGQANADEFEPTAVDQSKNSVSISVTHFSGYMVSYGRW